MKISSFYIHVPFCRHICNYCDFFKYKLGGAHTPSFDEYEEMLKNNWKELKRIEAKEAFNVVPQKLETIYLGGGTPSLWGSRGILFLKKFFEGHKFETKGSQWTLEVDPGTSFEEEILEWKDLGVNRFSLGLQSLDEDYLKIADRLHSQEEAYMMLEILHKNKCSFSADFLLGLPEIKGKKRDIEKELEEILSYKPDHLSLYILNAPKTYPLRANIPEDEKIREEYLFVSEYLQKKGFNHYEVSNFALENKESKHNFIYWEGKSYWGMGPSATGQWRLSDESMLRYKFNAHGKIILEELGASELRLENLYLNLRTKKGLNTNHLSSEAMQRWLDASYAIIKENQLFLTAQGFLVLDSIIEDLL